ncbi:MAG: CvpA family protein [Candidatus Pacebacteria bacterium]|nr:CvpA family protein [Candidatus Paceibacterota bacterium]
MIGNWIDLIIIFYLLTHFADGAKRGLYSIIVNMVSFVVALIISYFTYSYTAHIFISLFGLENVYANIIGFFLNMFVIKFIILVMSRRKLPDSLFVFNKCFKRRVTCGFTSLLYSSIVVFLLLSITLSFSLPFIFRNQVASSSFGKVVVVDPVRINKGLENIFGDVLSTTMSKFDFMTVGDGKSETIYLGYTTSDVKVDEKDEADMLKLINQERESRNLLPLIEDEQAKQTARKHGIDMFQKGYFSHVNLENQIPSYRMKQGGVEFNFSGENLALSKDLPSAHNGLMNSTGHRKNILQPLYHRVGIGVIDGGEYGKIFVQNFAD